MVDFPNLCDNFRTNPPPPCPRSSPHRYDLSQPKAANLIESAVELVLNKGIRTGDIKQPGCTLVGCKEMGNAVVAALAEISG